MKNEKKSFRDTKNELKSWLIKKNIDEIYKLIDNEELKKYVSPLFSCFYNSNELLRFKAVTLMGIVVSKIAEEDMEDAKIIIRRFMWNLNDESGGIGWGSPEAFAETLARSKNLARIYNRILISYINPDGNYLELESLQEGILWGIARFASVNPELAVEGIDFLEMFLKSKNYKLRGLSLLGLSCFRNFIKIEIPSHLVDNRESITVFSGIELIDLKINELATAYLSNNKKTILPFQNYEI